MMPIVLRFEGAQCLRSFGAYNRAYGIFFVSKYRGRSNHRTYYPVELRTEGFRRPVYGCWYTYQW